MVMVSVTVLRLRLLLSGQLIMSVVTVRCVILNLLSSIVVIIVVDVVSFAVANVLVMNYYYLIFIKRNQSECVILVS